MAGIGNRIALFFLMVSAVTMYSCGSPPANPDKPNHTGNGFRNIGEYEESSFFDFLKWRWERAWKDIPEAGDYSFELAPNDPAFLRVNRDRTTLTWIGHATVLLQAHGRNILTDPHFSERASPVQWMGPRRAVPPGLSLVDLPRIDFVVLSHDHYDSLDENSIIALHSRPGGGDTVFVAPLGFRSWLAGRGINRIVELDWWERHEEEGLSFVAVPVRHWSKRSLFSRNKRLWAGWVLLAGDFRFFFSGDTGYAPFFTEIGSRYGPFNLAAIPIGAYEPRWFMQKHHVTPEEAVQIHKDLKSEKSVGIHWGTFVLTDEPLDEPPKRLEKARDENGMPEDEIMVLRHGETIMLD